MDRYQQIEIDGQAYLAIEVLRKIRRGEDMLNIPHAELEGMTSIQLAEYLQELRCKWKERNEPAQNAQIPVDTEPDASISDAQQYCSERNISLKVFELANAIGKKYGITGRSICDRYLQVCKMQVFDAEAIKDLRDNVLLDIDGKEESWLYAFVEPIKSGCLETKPELESTQTEIGKSDKAKKRYK